MKSSTETLIKALRVLARDIQSDDGVANAAISEAADRLEEQQERIRRLEDALTSIANQLEFLAKRLRFGCGNAGCQVREPVGLHTNGACNCQPTNYAKHLMGLAIECEQQGHFWTKAKEAKP